MGQPGLIRQGNINQWHRARWHKAFGPLLCATMQHQSRFAAGQGHNFHIAPENPFSETGSQGLGAGFLGRKHLRITICALVGTPISAGLFQRREAAIGKTISKPLQGGGDARNLA